MSKTATSGLRENDSLKAYAELVGQQDANKQTSFPNSNSYWDGYYRPFPDYGHCPNCGYCPHCGRGGHRPYFQPYITCGVSSSQQFQNQ